MKRVSYKIRNWNKHNQSLKNRYNLNFWISAETLTKWHAEGIGTPGRPYVYSNKSIEIMLIPIPKK